eukprot:g1889.t1
MAFSWLPTVTLATLAAAAAVEQASTCKVGSLAVVFGLTGRPELNGAVARVSQLVFDDTHKVDLDRWVPRPSAEPLLKLKDGWNPETPLRVSQQKVRCLASGENADARGEPGAAALVAVQYDEAAPLEEQQARERGLARAALAPGLVVPEQEVGEVVSEDPYALPLRVDAPATLNIFTDGHGGKRQLVHGKRARRSSAGFGAFVMYGARGYGEVVAHGSLAARHSRGAWRANKEELARDPSLAEDPAASKKYVLGPGEMLLPPALLEARLQTFLPRFFDGQTARASKAIGISAGAARGRPATEAGGLEGVTTPVLQQMDLLELEALVMVAAALAPGEREAEDPSTFGANSGQTDGQTEEGAEGPRGPRARLEAAARNLNGDNIVRVRIYTDSQHALKLLELYLYEEVCNEAGERQHQSAQRFRLRDCGSRSPLLEEDASGLAARVLGRRGGFYVAGLYKNARPLLEAFFGLLLQLDEFLAVKYGALLHVEVRHTPSSSDPAHATRFMLGNFVADRLARGESLLSEKGSAVARGNGPKRGESLPEQVQTLAEMGKLVLGWTEKERQRALLGFLKEQEALVGLEGGTTRVSGSAVRTALRSVFHGSSAGLFLSRAIAAEEPERGEDLAGGFSVGNNRWTLLRDGSGETSASEEESPEEPPEGSIVPRAAGSIVTAQGKDQGSVEESWLAWQAALERYFEAVDAFTCQFTERVRGELEREDRGAPTRQARRHAPTRSDSDAEHPLPRAFDDSLWPAIADLPVELVFGEDGLFEHVLTTMKFRAEQLHFRKLAVHERLYRTMMNGLKAVQGEAREVSTAYTLMPDYDGRLFIEHAGKLLTKEKRDFVQQWAEAPKDMGIAEFVVTSGPSAPGVARALKFFTEAASKVFAKAKEGLAAAAPRASLAEARDRLRGRLATAWWRHLVAEHVASGESYPGTPARASPPGDELLLATRTQAHLWRQFGAVCAELRAWRDGAGRAELAAELDEAGKLGLRTTVREEQMWRERLQQQGELVNNLRNFVKGDLGAEAREMATVAIQVSTLARHLIGICGKQDPGQRAKTVARLPATLERKFNKLVVRKNRKNWIALAHWMKLNQLWADGVWNRIAAVSGPLVDKQLDLDAKFEEALERANLGLYTRPCFGGTRFPLQRIQLHQLHPSAPLEGQALVEVRVLSFEEATAAEEGRVPEEVAVARARLQVLNRAPDSEFAAYSAAFRQPTLPLPTAEESGSRGQDPGFLPGFQPGFLAQRTRLRAEKKAAALGRLPGNEQVGVEQFVAGWLSQLGTGGDGVYVVRNLGHARN